MRGDVGHLCRLAGICDRSVVAETRWASTFSGRVGSQTSPAPLTSTKQRPAPAIVADAGAGVGCEDPAMTDFRAKGTIMGLAGLTAVFGMGTGGTPPVSSPESAGGRSGPPAAVVPVVVTQAQTRMQWRGRRCESHPRRVAPIWIAGSSIEGSVGSPDSSPPRVSWGRRRIGVVKRLAVRTGRLRRSPAVHSRPIDLVVFQEPSHLRAGNLVLKRASRLDAFSAYPFPT